MEVPESEVKNSNVKKEYLDGKNVGRPSSRAGNSSDSFDTGKGVEGDAPSSDQESGDDLSVSCLDIYERITQSALNNRSPQPQNNSNHVTVPITDNEPSSSSGPQTNQVDADTGTQRVLRSASALSLRDVQQPNISSSAFSFLMTLAFVLVLWLVVFMVFGSRGHAIAGIFIALFIVGIVINTCFFKFYFRLRLFLGTNAALVAAEQQARLQNANSSSLSSVKTEEPPPSYDSVDQSPPPYDLLQFYNRKCSDNATAPFHLCPYCEKKSPVFGLCNSCKNKIDGK